MPRSIAHVAPKNALGVIALFVAIVELAFAYPVTVLAGGTQQAFVAFMLLFPVAVLGVFLIVLIRYPENLYAPSDFKDPQLFAQLISRRDEGVRDRLRLTSEQLTATTAITQEAVRDIRKAVIALAGRLDELPSLNIQDRRREIAEVDELLTTSQKFLTNLKARNLESFAQHRLAGIRDVWFDTDTLGSTWSLDLLVDVALAAVAEAKEKGFLQTGGKGEVKLGDMDVDRIFSYQIKADKSWGARLDLKHLSSYGV